MNLSIYRVISFLGLELTSFLKKGEEFIDLVSNLSDSLSLYDDICLGGLFLI